MITSIRDVDRLRAELVERAADHAVRIDDDLRVEVLKAGGECRRQKLLARRRRGPAGAAVVRKRKKDAGEGLGRIGPRRPRHDHSLAGHAGRRDRPDPEPCVRKVRGVGVADGPYGGCRTRFGVEALGAVRRYEHLDRVARVAVQEDDVDRAVGGDIDFRRQAGAVDQRGTDGLASDADPRGPVVLCPRKMQVRGARIVPRDIDAAMKGARWVAVAGSPFLVVRAVVNARRAGPILTAVGGFVRVEAGDGRLTVRRDADQEDVPRVIPGERGVRKNCLRDREGGRVLPGDAAVGRKCGRKGEDVMDDVAELLRRADDLHRIVGIDRDTGFAACVGWARVVRDLDV